MATRRKKPASSGPSLHNLLNQANREATSEMRRMMSSEGLPVEFWDERLTTAEAQRVLLAADVSRARRKEVVDTRAASIILQGWLDARSGTRHEREDTDE